MRPVVKLPSRKVETEIGQQGPRPTCELVRDLALPRLALRMEIFDQENLVPLFTMDQVIDELFGHEQTEAAGPQTPLFANSEMTKEVLGRIGDSGMMQFVEREALARILDLTGNGASAANVGDLHVLAGIKICTVLHGVEKNFTECADDFVLVSFRNVPNSSAELFQAPGSCEIAFRHQANPFRRRRNNLNAVIPCRFRHGLAHHVGEIGKQERTAEVTKGLFTQGSDHVAACPFIRNYDQADVRADASDFPEEINILGAGGFFPGDDQVVRVRPSEREDSFVVDSSLNTPPPALQNASQHPIEVGAGINNERGLRSGKRGSG